jgi:hypothetical protein
MAELISKVEAYIGRKVDYQSGEVNIQIDSDGTRIVEWNITSHKEPTQSQLDALESKADELETEYKLNAVRSVRNQKLAETDWEIVMHKEKGTNIPTALKTYRQALRDITDTYTSLDDVVWPEKP